MQPRAIMLAMALMPAGFVNAQEHEAVDRLMSRYEGAVPGASLLVIRDGEPALQKSYGFSDLEQRTEASPASNYRLASVTKQFTAAAILLLVDDGRLSLDERVRKWLPSLPKAAAAVTIRQLLTHTSGLVDYEDMMPDDSVEQLRDADVLRLLEGQATAYFEPSSDYRYSNSGYALLALVIERAAKQSFQDFLRERIFLPLGMDGTLAYVREGPAIGSRAFGYSQVDDEWVRTDQSTTSAVLGDGGVYSSIIDLAKWDAALYDDRLLSEASRQQVFKAWTKTDDPGVDYGFGWRITSDSLWHSGESIGFRNVIVRYPEQRLTVVMLTNRDEPEPYTMALAIAKIFLRQSAAASKTTPAIR